MESNTKGGIDIDVGSLYTRVQALSDKPNRWGSVFAG